VVIRWPVGGIRTFLRYVYRQFDPQTYRLTILTVEGREFSTLKEDLEPINPLYYKVPANFKPAQFLRLITRAIKTEKIDLIHSHGLTAGVYSCIPARIRGVPHMTTVHDVFRQDQFTGWKGRFLKIGLSVVLPWIDRIHAVSKDTAQNVLEHVPRLRKFNGKMTVIPNGIDVTRFYHAQRRDLRKELGLERDVFLIGFLGRFMPQKGFRYLVDAMQILTDDPELTQRPVLIAFGGGGFVREEGRRIKEKGLDGSVRMLPFTKDPASTLKGLNLVVMPSLWEASPLLAMEAMVAGVPVVGTNCIGLREVLEGTPCVTVLAGDSRALADALRHEINNPSVAKAEAFAEAACRRFDSKTQAKGLESLMRGLLQARA